MPHEQVRLHLTTCDFCGAALRLISRHAPAEAAQEAPAPEAGLPLHLRLLALSALSGTPRSKRAKHRSAA
jgi:hypothetical protein